MPFARGDDDSRMKGAAADDGVRGDDDPVESLRVANERRGVDAGGVRPRRESVRTMQRSEITVNSFSVEPLSCVEIVDVSM